MRMKLFYVLLCFSFFTFMTCGPAFIDQRAKIRITTDSNIHDGPGPDYRVIETVRAGSELVLLESDNDWHRVRLSDGRTGWIFRGVARTVAPEKIVVIEDARIRRGPGEQYTAFAIAKKGKTLDSRGERNHYFLVDLPTGQSGWVSKNQAEKVTYRNLTATQKANVYQLPDPNSQVLLRVDPGTELIQLNRRGDYYMVRLRGGDTGWIHKDYLNTIKERTIVARTRADIKYGPSIEYDEVEVVEKGERLTLLLRKNNWYKVRTAQGNVGWIYKDFITQSFASRGVSASGTAFIESTAPVYVVTNTDCNIRQGYGINWEKIARVKEGTILVQIGRRDNWLRIKMPNQRIGWVREDLVDFDPTILVTLDNCNIRLGPSTTFRVKTKVPKGTPLAKISEENGWSRVYLPDGEIGWIRNDLSAEPDESLFANQDCNVREGPSTSYRKIDRIKMGTPVVQLDRQDNWYKVRLPSNNKEGWIREDLLSSTTGQMVTNDRVNIRMGPGTEYQVLTEVAKNTSLIVISEQGNWYQIKLPDGRIGWIRKDLVSYSYYPIPQGGTSGFGTYALSSASELGTYISPSSALKPFSVKPPPRSVKMVTTSAVNLRVGPSTNDAKITLLQAGTPVIRINQRGEWYEVQTNDGVLGFVHQSGFSSGSNKIYTNTKSNIRFGPSTDYRVIASLPAKTELTKIEQRDDWVNVKMTNGQKGWIHKDLVDLNKGPAPPPPTKTEAVSGTLITTSDGKILKGPAETYPTVKSIKRNTQLKMISKYKNWYEVETLTGEKGWITTALVNKKDNKKIIVIRRSEVHQAPTTQSDLITIVKVGQYFTPMGQESGWTRIPVKAGVTGWIVSNDVMELKYPPVFVNTGMANIMKFADEKSNRLAVVKEGVQLTPIDEQDEWLFVQLPRGDKGWILKRLVNRQKHPRIRVVRSTEAYEEPNAGSLLKATLAKGDEFFALEKNKNWYKIFLRGAEVGWVYGGYVSEVTKGSLLVKQNSYLRMGPGLDYRIIGTVPSGEKLKWLDQKGDWNQVQISSGEVGWIFEKLAKNVTLPEMTAQRNSTVYGGAGTNYARVGEVVRGRKYVPVTRKNGWYEIQLPVGTGWVPMDVFSPKKSRLVFTLDRANIRSGPGTQYSVVQTVQPAVDLTVLGSEGEWYYVQLQDGTKGYIKKDLIFEE